ncbi:MAG: hypothetical protein JWR24_3170 [Actinoallomurus sp.]|nr:hypothetical protein [Actinoallomurus sp.]
MRRLVLAAGMAVLLAGCGNAAQTAKNPQPAGSAPPVRVHRVNVGDVVTLTGTDDAGGAGRLRLAVRVEQVVATAIGKGAFENPRKGERFMAVRFVLKNVGDTTYDDSPTYGAKAVDGSGRGYDPTVATVSAGAGFARVVRLRHGQSKSGFVVFAVPKKAKVTDVQYALNAEFAEDRGEWRVP